jgi:hypothetical protein
VNIEYLSDQFVPVLFTNNQVFVRSVMVLAHAAYYLEFWIKDLGLKCYDLIPFSDFGDKRLQVIGDFIDQNRYYRNKLWC